MTEGWESRDWGWESHDEGDRSSGSHMTERSFGGIRSKWREGRLVGWYCSDQGSDVLVLFTVPAKAIVPACVHNHFTSIRTTCSVCFSMWFACEGMQPDRAS
jgi:hypothetical protein